MAEPGADLVRRAQEGSEEAVQELIEGQQRYIYSVALNVVGNPADAADVAQEAVIRLLRSLHTFRSETRFTTWLYRLVYNLALDQLRRRGRMMVALDGAESEHGLIDELVDPDPLIDPALNLDRKEVQARVRSALSNLPPVQRAALTLYYFEDMAYEDIAEVLGLPLNTLKSHIRRAKLRLAATLVESEERWIAVK